jgi:hypothetical protein
MITLDSSEEYALVGAALLDESCGTITDLLVMTYNRAINTPEKDQLHKAVKLMFIRPNNPC